MSPEQFQSPAPKRPYEDFGLTEKEALFWRVSQERFQAILDDEQTIIHQIKETSNDFGEFLFVTTSRPGNKSRIAMTFYGLGYHDQRERWITDEWFWYQSEPFSKMMEQKIEKEEAEELLHQRLESISPSIQEATQTQRGKIFEILADLTDEDGALAEMEDLEFLNEWLFVVDQQVPPEEPPDTLLDESPAEPPPTGENLLDLLLQPPSPAASSPPAPAIARLLWREKVEQSLLNSLILKTEVVIR